MLGGLWAQSRSVRVRFTGIIVGAAGRKLFYELARPNQINDPTTQGWVHVDY